MGMHIQILSRAVHAEWRKAWSTMGVPLAVALSALPGVVTFIANRQTSDCVECVALDVVPQNLAVIIIPAVAVGALLASGDFLTADPTRQQATGWVVNHGAFPRRWPTLLAKSILVIVLSLAVAFFSYVLIVFLGRPEGVGVVQMWLRYFDRLPAVCGYWVSMALLSHALTLLARSATFPLALLIVNSSLVPLSLQLSSMTTHVALLPDVAAFGLIIPEQLPHNTFFYPELLERVTRSDMTNAAVLVAWAVIPLVVAWMVMMRREWK